MTTDDETTKDPTNAEEVGQGVTNTPRDTGDLDEGALETSEDKLEQAGGGH